MANSKQLLEIEPPLEAASQSRVKSFHLGDAATWYGWLTMLWIALRPSQWLKNLFVLAPLFFSQNVFVREAATRAMMALGLFCLVSSAVYLLNDVADQASDRLHPEKRRRPLASGLLAGWVAYVVSGGLLFVSLVAGLVLSPPFAAILAAYSLLNVLYSVWLKRVVILDVFVIATGYLLRVVGGAVVIQVEISRWLFICTTLLALFIALCKRRHEIVLLDHLAPQHRQVLADYPREFLDMMIGIITAAAVVSYMLYTVSDEMMLKFQGPGMLLTVPFVLYGFFRYLYLVYRRTEGGDPTQSIVTDRSMMVNLFLWAAAAGAVLYGRSVLR